MDWIPVEGRNRDAEAGGTKVWDGDASEGAKFDVQRGGERQPEAERCIMADHVSLCRTVENEEGLGERIGGEDAGIQVTRHGATEKIAPERGREQRTGSLDSERKRNSAKSEEELRRKSTCAPTPSTASSISRRESSGG